MKRGGDKLIKQDMYSKWLQNYVNKIVNTEGKNKIKVTKEND